MFDYKQRPITEEYEEGHDRIWGKKMNRCEVSEDVCLVHSEPLKCEHGCSKSNCKCKVNDE